MDILIEEFEGSLWVATAEKNRLTGLEMDPWEEEVRWGSIYLARIVSIDARLDAVYLDLDGDNTGLLYNKDVRLAQEDGSILKGGDKPIGKVFAAGDLIAVQAKTAYMPQDETFGDSSENKIASMSMDITLPGRYVIYCPMMRENRLSNRIRDKALRKQLQKMSDDLDSMKGLILRAAAANTQTDILRREAGILQDTWKKMQPYLEGDQPGLIMAGPDAIQRVLGDHASESVRRIEVVTMEHYGLAEQWCSIFAPDLVPKIEPLEIDHADQDFALFDYRDLTGEIDALFQNYAKLPCGGNIIIQATAALTAIDVNRGAAQGSNLAINLEAIDEAMRQIRLRNLGGAIYIDLLKSQNRRASEDVLSKLEEKAALDPCTVQIHGLTSLGMAEISRRRRTPSLRERMGGKWPLR